MPDLHNTWMGKEPCPKCGVQPGLYHDDCDYKPPVRVTDKREQRRLEAEAARQLAEEQALQSPEQPDGETAPLEDDTVLADTIARVDRIQELRAKHSEPGGMTSEEGQELLRLQGEQEEADRAAQDGVQAMTAFIVIIGHDGSAVASHDLNQTVFIDREATTDDMYSGAAIVVRDIEAAIASKHVVFGLSVSAQAMREKAGAIQQAQMLQGRSPNLGRRRG